MLAPIIGAVLAIAGATQASAGCAEADIAGSWQVSSTVSENGGLHWLQCDLRIERDGDITDGMCHGPDMAPITMQNGWVKVKDSASCTFKGEFQLNDTVNYVNRATLSDGGNAAKGDGSFSGGFFTFTMRRGL